METMVARTTLVTTGKLINNNKSSVIIILIILGITKVIETTTQSILSCKSMIFTCFINCEQQFFNQQE